MRTPPSPDASPCRKCPRPPLERLAEFTKRAGIDVERDREPLAPTRFSLKVEGDAEMIELIDLLALHGHVRFKGTERAFAIGQRVGHVDETVGPTAQIVREKKRAGHVHAHRLARPPRMNDEPVLVVGLGRVGKLIAEHRQLELANGSDNGSGFVLNVHGALPKPSSARPLRTNDCDPITSGPPSDSRPASRARYHWDTGHMADGAPTQTPAPAHMAGLALTEDAVRLSSLLTFPYRVFSVAFMGAVCGLTVYFAAQEFPLNVELFLFVNNAICIWVLWPYLFLEDAWLEQSILFMGRQQDALDMADIADVSCTRFFQPQAVCITMLHGPPRKRWFMPGIRLARFGTVHPLVHTLGGLAAHARIEKTARLRSSNDLTAGTNGY
jgi:hypothetical protein